MAVSYTHLDVYKRQVLTHTFFPEKAIPNFKISVIPSSFISESYRNSPICFNASLDPVSYTHLINKKETGVNLRRIMDMRGVKPKDIQEYLGFGCVQSVYRWLDGVSMPTVDNPVSYTHLRV